MLLYLNFINTWYRDTLHHAQSRRLLFAADNVFLDTADSSCQSWGFLVSKNECLIVTLTNIGLSAYKFANSEICLEVLEVR